MGENHVHSYATHNGCSRSEVRLPNPHLADVKEHFLYHLGISTATTDFPATFGDVKFVCVGGTVPRMEEFAHYLAGELGLTQNGTPAVSMCTKKTERYVMFKVGPCLIASHGIGVASLSVVLHELFKLLHLARCSDVTLLRIGTCGGIGVEEGTVIISDGALNSQLRPVYTWYSLGQARERPVVVDAELARELQACAKHGDHFPTVVGKTFCADDFYEAQGRLDGAVCEFSEEDKQKFMERLWTLGVRNIEMESAGLFSLCHAVGINVFASSSGVPPWSWVVSTEGSKAGAIDENDAAVACVCVVNRLESEEPKNNSTLLAEYQRRPQVLAARFIIHRLGNQPPSPPPAGM